MMYVPCGSVRRFRDWKAIVSLIAISTPLVLVGAFAVNKCGKFLCDIFGIWVWLKCVSCR